MKRKYFISLGLALLGCPFLLWSQDRKGVFVKNGATVNVFNGALVYSAGDLEVEKQGKVDNKGNIKVDGVYRNRAERDAKNVVLRYEAEKKYGQLILKQGQNIDGRAAVEYPAANGGYVFGALPFSNVYDARADLAQDIGVDFAYDGTKTVQALENSSLLKFNAINSRNIAQWEAVNRGTPFDLTKAYAFKAGSEVFSLSGVPVSGPYTIQYQGLADLNLKAAFTEYQDTKLGGYQPVREIIGGDYFAEKSSEDRSRRFFPFANPTTANIDLLKVGNFSGNVQGIAVPKKEVREFDLSVSYLPSYYISAFLGDIPTGDIDALYARPRDLVYVKMKQGKELSLTITDEAKTFSKSSYTKGTASYHKLCLGFDGKRAYVFATDGVKDGEFVDGEARQPFNNVGESTIYTLQNKAGIEAKDYNIPLHTNVISSAWDKPIRLIVNDTVGNGKIEVLKQEGCTSGSFSIVNKGHPKGSALAEDQSIQVEKQGWNLYDIYYNNPTVRTRRAIVEPEDVQKRPKAEAFWCEGGQVCFNPAAERKNVDIRVLSQDGTPHTEDKVSASKPYKLPSDVEVYTIQYRFEGEKEYKVLQAPSTDN